MRHRTFSLNEAAKRIYAESDPATSLEKALDFATTCKTIGSDASRALARDILNVQFARTTSSSGDRVRVNFALHGLS